MDAPHPAPPATTASRATNVLGALSFAGLVLLLLFALVWSPADRAQRDSVRLMYVHVPTAILAFTACAITTIAAGMWLRRRTEGWWVLGGAAAEVGLVYTGLCLVTGSIWGRPTWGTYWDWDPRLTSTALMFLVYLGYLAIRRLPADVEVRNRRTAIVGIAGFANVPIVHFAVDWWRSLHQDATIGTLDVKIQGLQLFTLFLGFAAFAVTTAWLLVHRFRLAWLEDRAEEHLLEQAIAARRHEAGVGGEALA